MKDNIILLDGAVGTSLWAMAEQNNVEKVPVWKYNIEHPEFVENLATQYCEAGSQMILGNTFGANAPVVSRSSDYTSYDVVLAGTKIAKTTAEKYGVKAIVSIGPLMQLLEPYGDLTECEAEKHFEEMVSAGIDGNADGFLIQTFMDIEMMKIATKVAKKSNLPVMCAMTFEKQGRTMMGNSVEDVINALEPMKIDAIGTNCSLGPSLAMPIIEEFSRKTDIPLIFKPNAGLPISNADGTVQSDYDAKTFVEEISPAIEFVKYIGGCCGTSPDFIKELKKAIANT